MNTAGGTGLFAVGVGSGKKSIDSGWGLVGNSEGGLVGNYEVAQNRYGGVAGM